MLIDLIRMVQKYVKTLPDKHANKEELEMEFSKMLEGVESTQCPILVMGNFKSTLLD